MRKQILIALFFIACDATAPTAANDLSPDLTPPAEDAAPADLATAPRDLRALPDLTSPVDLAQPPACSMTQACAACGDHRQCTADKSCQATCGACDDGYELNMGACEKVSSSPAACHFRSDCVEMMGMYCLQMDTGDQPMCRPAPCAAGQTWDRVNQKCLTTCNCFGANLWPVTDVSGGCFCDPGAAALFYDRSGGGAIKECDHDGDGWLNKEVGDEINAATHPAGGAAEFDYTVLVNVRCPINVLDRVELVNEWQQTKTLLPADLQVTASGVPLYEDPSNDDGKNPALKKLHLSATSANSLTKVCSELDLDLNGRNDYQEAQSDAPVDVYHQWMAPYQPLTAFVELYDVRFVPSPSPDTQLPGCPTCPDASLSGTRGTLQIVERRRCDGDFPFAYSESDAGWRGCTRRRDRGFSSSDSEGYDFAAYDCDGTNGVCSYSWPSPWPDVSQPAPPPPLSARPGSPIPAHGMCDSGVVAGDLWRGMTHYSQFRCAQADGTAGQAGNGVVPLKQVQPSPTPSPDDSQWEAEDCALPAEIPAGSSSSATLARYSCAATSNVADGDVRWFARRYRGYDPPFTSADYQGGCIDEGAEWQALCADGVSLTIGNPASFGGMLCGPDCFYDAVSGANEVFYTATSTQTMWLCAHPTISRASGSFSGGGWTLDGELTLGLPRTPLTNCPGPNCFTIR